MGIFTKVLLSLTAPALLIGASEMSATPRLSNFDISSYAFKGSKSSSPFGSARMKQIQHANGILEGNKTIAGIRRENSVSPEIAAKLGPAAVLDDIDTPSGDLWYYSGNFKYTYIKMSEDYSYPVMQEYEFNIYNEKLEKVGTIRDKINYKVYDAPIDTTLISGKDQYKYFGPNHCEKGIAACQIAPIVTRNFFNRDDRAEIMVSLSVQTTYFVNNNYNIVYQLEGETYQDKDHQGNLQTYNKPIKNIPSQLGDVLSTIGTDGNELTFMTFMDDYEPEEDFEIPDLETRADENEGEGEGDDPGDIVIPGYWENYCSYGIDATVFRAPVDGENDIQPVKAFSTPLSKLPGDMQSSPFLISLMHDGKAYYVSARYDDTFFNPYHSPLAEMTMREGNSLIIEVYQWQPSAKALNLIQTTKIPTYLTKDDSNPILASFFGVGDFRYRDDLNFGDDGKIGFYITKRDMLAGSDDSYLYTYYYYNSDGTLEKTLFKNCDSHISMSDLEGFEPQELFIDTDMAGDYVFHFVDLNSVKEVLTLNYRFQIDEDSDPERMTANMDRVKRGDTYLYVNELRLPTQDDAGNDIGQILWFDRKGNFDHLDEINMGKGVYYAMYYIEGKTLDPDFFFKDKYNEYMLLVKRNDEGRMIEELMVAQAVSDEYPYGRTFLSAGPDERGSLARVFTDDNSETPHIFVTRVNLGNNNEYAYNWDIYSLPFLESGINTVASASSAGDAISFDGETVMCPNEKIEIFAANGIRVAEGTGALYVAQLEAGIYIVRAAGGTAKIMVK